MHAYLGRIPLDFMLSKPVVVTPMKQNPATVGVDMDSLVVRPRLIRKELVEGLKFHARESHRPTGSTCA